MTSGPRLVERMRRLADRLDRRAAGYEQIGKRRMARAARHAADRFRQAVVDLLVLPDDQRE